MKKKIFLSIFVLYFLLAAAFTCPLVFKMSSATYGYAGDNLGAIHYFWWWKKSLLLGLNHRDSFLEEAPFGVTIDRESGAALYYLPLKLATLLTNEVFAYNLILLLSFPLAGLAMFLLAYSLTKNAMAGFLAGLIFSFSPYHFWKSYNHLDLALIWPLPLYVWSLLRITADLKADLRQSRLIKDGLLAGCLLAMVVLTNFYYGYFMFLFTAIFSLIFLLVRVLKDRSRFIALSLYYFIALLLSGLVTLIVVLPFTYQTLRESRDIGGEGQSLFKQEAFHRPLNNLISLSARPWDYLLPSQDNPFFGRFIPSVYQWIQTKSEDFKTVSAPPHERTVYLGWVSLLLSGAAVFLLIKSAPFRQCYGKVSAMFLFTALVLVIISLPPFIIVKGVRFNLPSFYLYSFFPMFRAYVRLGIVVLLCFVLLSSFSLAHLFTVLKNFSCYKKPTLPLAIFVTGFLSLLALLEFVNVPPPKVIDFSVTPSAYAWLAQQSGEKIILEWPSSFNVVEGFLWQRGHQKGLANWSSQSPYYSLWQFLPDLYLPAVSRKLAGLGVDYVFVHKKLLFPQVNPVDDLWYTRSAKDPERYKVAPAGTSLVREDADINVFAVEKENPAKIFTVTDRGKRTDARLLGGEEWLWSGEDNHFYFYSLLDEKKEASVDLDFYLSEKDREKIKGIFFDGEPLSWRLTKPLKLTIKPGENDLWVVLDGNYPRQDPITFRKIFIILGPQI